MLKGGGTDPKKLQQQIKQIDKEPEKAIKSIQKGAQNLLEGLKATSQRNFKIRQKPVNIRIAANVHKKSVNR